MSRELGIKLVATNDCHYIEKEHAIAHNILLLLADKGGADYTKLRYGTDQVYFKSTEQMKELFKHIPEAIENTLEIEEKIDLKLDFQGFHYPDFPIPDDSPAKTLDDYFELLAREGLDKRFNKIHVFLAGFTPYLLTIGSFHNSKAILPKNFPKCLLRKSSIILCALLCSDGQISTMDFYC